MSDTVDVCGCGWNNCRPEVGEDGEHTGYCSECGQHIGAIHFETGNRRGGA